MAKKLEVAKGTRFGRLTVISEVPGQKRRTFNLQCDCGSTHETTLDLLRRSYLPTRSCGCAQREWASKKGRPGITKPSGEAAFNDVVRRYKYQARRRNLVFDLSDKQFQEIIRSDCYYCGRPPSNVSFKKGGMNGEFVYNGVDRLDNRAGYTVQNCVPCCAICNRAKHTMGFTDFVAWVNRVHETLRSKSS